MKKNYFYNFYDDHKVSPVTISKRKIKKHFNVRQKLYDQLSLYSNLIENKNIIEFGPGSGQNALFNLGFNPKSYTLVDNSDTCISAAKKYLSSSKNFKKIKFKKDTFENFNSNIYYDLVIAENCIPNNINPKLIFKKFYNYIKPGGFFLFNCTDSVGYFSEICRKIISSQLISQENNFNKKVNILLKFFLRDINYLKNMTRKHKDWIIDNLIQDSDERELFSIIDVVDTGIKYNLINTYPKFINSWDWYKDLNDKGINSQSNIIKRYYYKNILNFLDKQKTYEYSDINLGKKIYKLTDEIFELTKFKDINKQKKLFISKLKKIQLILKNNKLTSLNIYIDEILSWLQDQDRKSLKSTHKFWGRANTHILIQKPL